MFTRRVRSALSVMLFLALVAALAPLSATAQTVTPPLKAQITADSLPTTAQVGLRLTITLSVRNIGSQTWLASGPDAVSAGYRWAKADGTIIAPDDAVSSYTQIVTPLPKDVPPGVSPVNLAMQIGVPATADAYVLHLDMFQKGQPFADRRTSTDVTGTVTVRARDSLDNQPVTIVSLPLYATSTAVPVAWQAQDTANAPASYDLQYKIAPTGAWTDWLVGTAQTSATFYGEDAKTYLFRVRGVTSNGTRADWPAADSVIAQQGQAHTSIDTLPPSSRVDVLPIHVGPDFVVRWSSYDNLIAGPLLYDVQYKIGADGQWLNWLTGVSDSAALFHGQPGLTYVFRSRALDYAGNQEAYPVQGTAQTTVVAALGAVAGTVDAPDIPAQNAYFPDVTKNGDGGTTGVVVTNPTNHPVDVFLRYTDRQGARITTDPAYALVNALAPGATATLSAAKLPVPNFTGSLVVNSSDPILAYATHLTPGVTGKATIILPAHDSAPTLYLPWVQRGQTTADTLLTIMRTEPADAANTPISATITYYTEGGSVAGTQKINLAPAASQHVSLDPTLPTRFIGSATISATGTIAATVENGTTTYPATAHNTPVSAPLPIYRTMDGISSTLVIFNPTDALASAQIDILDTTGLVIASTTPQTLAAHSRVSLNIGKVTLTGSAANGPFAGRVRVSIPGAQTTTAGTATPATGTTTPAGLVVLTYGGPDGTAQP